MSSDLVQEVLLFSPFFKQPTWADESVAKTDPGLLNGFTSSFIQIGGRYHLVLFRVNLVKSPKLCLCF